MSQGAVSIAVYLILSLERGRRGGHGVLRDHQALLSPSGAGVAWQVVLARIISCVQAHMEATEVAGAPDRERWLFKWAWARASERM